MVLCRRANSTTPAKARAPRSQRAPRINKNGAPIRSMRTPATRNPKTELEAATQRFVDLYDFAPIAYVSFDRAGRIEEANLAATALLGVPRDLLIGRPFAFYVADLDSFLHHLLSLPHDARTSCDRTRVEAEKGRADPGSTSKYADHFDNAKWRFALPDRHHRFISAQASRTTAGRAGAAA